MKRKSFSTRDTVQIGLFVVLIIICSWISIPTPVPFTLQTFAIFTAVLMLGGKRGTLAVLVYLTLGALGLPVFHGFSGGFGILLGSTGGYLLGFILTALIMWAMEPLSRKGPMPGILSMVLGLLACYTVGTTWFMVVYGRNNGAISLLTALGWCVFPFVIPDLVKIALACSVSSLTAERLRMNGSSG